MFIKSSILWWSIVSVALLCNASVCVMIDGRTLRNNLWSLTQCNEPKTKDSPAADVGLSNSAPGKRTSETGSFFKDVLDFLVGSEDS